MLPNPSRLHLLSIFLLFTLVSFSFCQSYNIYVDATNKNRNKDGSASNPFNNFLGVESAIISALNSGLPIIGITVYIKFNANPYSVPSYSFTVPNNAVVYIGFTNWDSFKAPKTLGDCDNLPQLNFDDGGWSFNNLGNFVINGVVITSQGNAINLKQASSVQIQSSCLKNSGLYTKSLVNAFNVSSLIAQNIVIDVRSGTSMIDFENYFVFETVNVKIKDIVVVFLSAAQCNMTPLNSALYFSTIKSSKMTTSILTATNITYLYRSEVDAHPQGVVLCAPGLKANGFQNFTLDGLHMNQQLLIPKTSIGHLVQSKNVESVVLTNIDLISNKYNVDVESYSVFMVSRADSLEITNLNYQKSTALGNNKGYQFCQTFNVNTTIYKSHLISENNMPLYFTFLNHTYDYNYDLSDGSVINGLASYEISNITMKENNIGDTESNSTYFHYIKGDPTILGSFNWNGFLYTQNNLTGKIIEMDLVGEPRVTKPTIMNFKDIAIVENQVVDMALMQVYTENSPNMPQDEEPLFEFYSVAINNMTIANNSFARGVNVNWMYAVNIINCIGVQVYTSQSTIVNNTFNLYNFILLDQQLTSVFFLNSLVQNNTFTNSQFIVTDYQELPVLGGKFIDTANNAVNAIYRYTVIRGCQFLDLKIENQTFINANNGYLMIFSNNFTNITQEDKPFLEGGAFTPIALNMMRRYNRNTTIERATFSVDLNLWGLFNSTFDRLQQSKENNGGNEIDNMGVVYYYLIANNTFSNINAEAETFMTLNGYNFKQSVIYLRANKFLNFTMGTQTSMIQVIKCNAFEYRNNYVANITGLGSILLLRKLDQMGYCSVRSNTITELTGTGIISAEGDSINTITIENNNFSSNYFLNNGIDISVVLNNGKITYFNNTFNDNILLLTNETLYHNYNFLSITAKLATGSQNTLFDSSIFKNNTVISTPGATQYGYSYGFLSFQIANSSIDFNNVTFSDNTLTDNNLKALFFIGQSVSISACNFTNNTKNSTEGFIFMYSYNITITDSYFGNLKDPHGKGAIDIATPAYLKYLCKVNITNNTFEDISAKTGSVLTASGILDMVFDSNNILDSFPTAAAGTIVMTESTCKPFCNFTNVSFNTSSQYGYSDTFLFKFVKLVGKAMVQHLNMNYPETKTADYEKDMLSAGEIVTMLESKEGTVILDEIVLEKNTNGVYLGLITYNSGSVEITNSNFTNLRFIGVNLIEQTYVQQSFSLKVKNVSFVDLTFIQKDIYPEYFGPIMIADNEDYSLSAVYGKIDIDQCVFEKIGYCPAVQFKAPFVYNISVTQSNFTSIQAKNGPALICFDGMQETSNLMITGCRFEKNKAEVCGGAIVVSDIIYNITKNHFIENTATKTGGAIYLLNSLKIEGLDSLNIFQENEALLYSNIASSPNSITVDIDIPAKFNTQKIFNVTNPTNKKKTYQYVITNMSSAALESSVISINVVDKDKNFAYDFSPKTFAVLKFGNQTVNISDCTNIQCVTQNKSISLPGKANDIISLEVHYRSEFNIPDVLIGIQLRECVPGEYRNNITNSCQKCAVNTYSLAPNVACQYCPSEAVCYGGNEMCPIEGYWRAEGNFTQIYQCRSDSTLRCLGSCKGCSTGYTGPLCGACDFENGYVEDELFGCVKCENPTLSLIITGVIDVVYIFFTLFLCYQTYKTNVCFNNEEELAASGLENKRIKDAYYLTLISRYLQNFMSIFAYSVGLRQIYETITHGNTSYRHAFSTPQCTYMALGIDSSQFLYVDTMVDALEPFVHLLVFILALPFIKGIHKKDWSASTFLGSSMLYCGVLYQSKIVGSLASYLTCAQAYIDAPDQRVIHHPNWSCSDPEYLKFTYYFVYPALAFWAIVVPMIFVTLIFKHGKKKVKQGAGVAIEVYSRQLKEKFYYWSVLVLLTQNALALCANKFALDYRTRVFVELGMIWVYETVIRWYEPYKVSSFNHLETATLNVLLLNILVSYYMLQDSYNILKPECVGLMVFVNVVVILYLFWQAIHMLDLASFKKKRQNTYQITVTSVADMNSSLSMSLNNSNAERNQHLNVQYEY